MEDPRMTPKAVLPGEMFDVEEMERAMAEAGVTAEDMANPEFNLMLNEDGTSFEAPAPDPNAPPAGSWAATARMMAACNPDDGFDWDAWKDEMKNEAMGL